MAEQDILNSKHEAEIVNNDDNQTSISSLKDKVVGDITKNENVKNGESEDTGAGLLDQKGPAREHTRSKMAILYVLGFFGIIFMCFAYAINVNASLVELKDTLVAVIGALSGTLGFIVGYYYKSTQEK